MSNISDFLADINADPNTVAQRDSNGCLTAADPIASSNLTTKNYVDAKVPGGPISWQALVENSFSTSTSYSAGTVSASGTTVTGAGTNWSGLPSSGLQIGFGTTNPANVQTWYPISSIGSNTTLTINASIDLASGTSYVITAVGVNSWQFGGLFGEFTNTVSKLNPVGANSIGNPATAPTVTVTGTPGATSYSYCVVAKDGLGNASVASIFKQITTGNNLLTTSNYNAISWSAVSGAGSYDIYRMQQQTTPPSITVGTDPGAALLVGTTLYVCNYGSGTVSVINTATNSVTATITVGSNPCALALSGTNLYVANYGSGTVSVINTETNALSATVTVGTNPISLAVSSTYVYVANYGGGTGNTVSAINISTNAVTTISMTSTSGEGPNQVIVTANYCFVRNTQTTGASINNAVISLSDNTILGYVPSIAALVNNPANDTVYCASGSQIYFEGPTSASLTVLATATLATNLSSLVMTPDGTRVIALGQLKSNPANMACLVIVNVATGAVMSQIPLSFAANSSSTYLGLDSTGTFIYVGNQSSGGSLFGINVDSLFNFACATGFSAYGPSAGILNQCIAVTPNGVYFCNSTSSVALYNGVGKIANTTATSYSDQGALADHTYPPQLCAFTGALAANSPSVQFLDCTNGNIFLTVPDATTCQGKEFLLQRTDSTTHVARIYPINSSQDVGGLFGWALWNKANPLWIKSDGNTWKFVKRPAAGEWAVGQLPPVATRGVQDLSFLQMAVLCNDQQLYTWGFNTSGNLSHGSSAGTIDLISPVNFDPIAGPAKGSYIVDWVNTGSNIYVVMSDGTLFASGNDTNGQLGDGATTTATYLKRVGGTGLYPMGTVRVWSYSFGSVTEAYVQTYWMRIDGVVGVCGFAGIGQLGTGGTTNPNPWTNINNPVHPIEIKCGQGSTSSVGYEFALACDQYGGLWAAGLNSFGNFGNGTTSSSIENTFVPVNVSGASAIAHVFPMGADDSTGGGLAFSACLDVAGNLYTCGFSGYGNLGIGSTASVVDSWTQVSAITNPVVQFRWSGSFVAGFFALDSKGNLWVAGWNGLYNLFLGNNTTPQSTAKQVSSIPGVLLFDGYLALNGASAAAGEFGVVWDGAVLRLSNSVLSDYVLGGIGVQDPVLGTGTSDFPLPASINNGEEKLIDLGFWPCGAYTHLFLLTDQGNLYACGDNTDGWLNAGYTTVSNTVPIGFTKIKVA